METPHVVSYKPTKIMKTHRIIKNLVALALLSTFNLLPSALLGQGSLTPPGLPAPTMKTADQIYSKLDPRTPISTVSFIITNSGSYYLTGNLTTTFPLEAGIIIKTNGVTLDLNGFTITSTAASAPDCAIILSGSLSDITIFNGHICSGVTNNGSGVYSGTGFGYGIYGAFVTNVLICKVSVTGVLSQGICVYGNGTLVEDCMVNMIGNDGISAQSVYNSTALNCGRYAINAITANGCYTANGTSIITYKYNMP